MPPKPRNVCQVKAPPDKKKVLIASGINSQHQAKVDLNKKYTVTELEKTLDGLKETLSEESDRLVRVKEEKVSFMCQMESNEKLDAERCGRIEFLKGRIQEEREIRKKVRVDADSEFTNMMSEWYVEKKALLNANETLWPSVQTERECQASHNLVVKRDHLSQVNLDTEIRHQEEYVNRVRPKPLAEWIDVIEEDAGTISKNNSNCFIISALAIYGRNLAMLVFSRLMFLYVFGCDSLVFTSNKWSSIDKSMFASSFKVHGIGPAKIARRLRKHTNLEKNDMFVFHFGRKLRLDRDALRKHECDHGALPEDACESEIFTRAIIRSNCEKCECNGIFLQDTLRALQFPQSNRMKDYKVGSSFIQGISKTHISLTNYTKHNLYINSGTKGLELQDGMGNRSNIKLDARKRSNLSYQLGNDIGLAKLSFTSTPCSKKELKIMQAKTDSIEEKENEYEKEEEEETENEENGIIDLTEMFASVHTRDL